MSKRLELGRSLQQNARTIIETIASDIRDGGIAFECYGDTGSAPSGCDSGPHAKNFTTSGSDVLILKWWAKDCPSSGDCFIEYYLAKSTATLWEVACNEADKNTLGLCYLSRRVNVSGTPIGTPMRISDSLVHLKSLRFYMTGVDARGALDGQGSEGKVTLAFTLSIAPRQGVSSELAQMYTIPVETTITQKLYKNF